MQVEDFLSFQLFYSEFLRSPLTFSKILFTDGSIKYMPFVKRLDAYISLPFVSYTGVLDRVSNRFLRGPDFVEQNGNLICEDPKIIWEIRGFRSYSNHILDAKVLQVINLKKNKECKSFQIGQHTKRKIKKAQQKQQYVYMLNNGRCDVFIDLYQRFCLKKGIPSFSRNFFQLLIDFFPSRVSIFIVEKNGEPIASAWLFKDKRYAEVTWICGVDGYKTHYSHFLLIYEIMQYCKNESIDFLSLGRSDYNSGIYGFKNLWKTVNIPLIFSYSKPCVNVWNLKESCSWVMKNTAKVSPTLTLKMGDFITKKVF
ncbi:MAG: GNAT family N-acetyltransferase [Bacteroidales bacterium]